MMPHRTLTLASTKTYTHSQGLSCCFRQWQADSHCHFLHGYALQIGMEFHASPDQLDKNGWVLDFGSMKPIKKWLEDTFDHKTLVAQDDPELPLYRTMDAHGIADILILPKVGMEAFATLIFEHVDEWLKDTCKRNVRLFKVTANEHETNGVTVYGF